MIGKKNVYDRWTAYGASKSANVLFASALRRKKGLEAVSLHPGAILTELVRYMTKEDQMAAGASRSCQLSRTSHEDVRTDNLFGCSIFAGFVDEKGNLSDKYTFKNIAQGVATYIFRSFFESSPAF